jgi:hypothetical protein
MSELAHCSPQSLRSNTPSNKRSEKNRAKERCETKRQEYAALNKAYENQREPESREPEP